MKTALFTLVSFWLGTGILFGSDAENLLDTYDDYGLKEPTLDMFTSNYASRWFSADDIGNPNDGYDNYLVNDAFWWFMDELRDAANQPMSVSSGFRAPPYHDGLPPPKAWNSLHQYGAATDIWRVNGVSWANMSDDAKNAFHDYISEAQIILQSEYGVRLHHRL